MKKIKPAKRAVLNIAVQPAFGHHRAPGKPAKLIRAGGLFKIRKSPLLVDYGRIAVEAVSAGRRTFCFRDRHFFEPSVNFTSGKETILSDDCNSSIDILQGVVDVQCQLEFFPEFLEFLFDIQSIRDGLRDR